MKFRWNDNLNRGIAECFWHTVRADIGIMTPIRFGKSDRQPSRIGIVSITAWDRDGHEIISLTVATGTDRGLARTVAQGQLDILTVSGMVGCSDPDACGQTATIHRAPKVST